MKYVKCIKADLTGFLVENRIYILAVIVQDGVGYQGKKESGYIVYDEKNPSLFPIVWDSSRFIFVDVDGE